jgi:LysR family glycine cleavage system transcriptional activator
MDKKILFIIMNKPLRSLSGLIDFESAARWGSFKLAAQELHKTPAAISQQMKQLEQVLGFALFIRHARHLTVTEKGRELAATVVKSLGELRTKVRALQEGDEELVLRVSTTHSFAMKWLVPRLNRFTERNPELDIRIESNDQVIDMAHSHCDVAIRHIRIGSDDDADVLIKERLVVVYAPTLLRKKVGSRKPTLSLSTLAKFPLLFEGTPENWLRLLRENRITNARCDFSRSYSHSGLLVQAAVAGHGVALVPYSIACEDILKGGLQIFSCKPVSSEYCYRIFYNRGADQMRKVKLFNEWLKAEVIEMDDTLS